MKGGAANGWESPRGVTSPAEGRPVVVLLDRVGSRGSNVVSWQLPEADDAYSPRDKSPDAAAAGQHAACQGSVPSNYAYDEDEGYAGMVLYRLSPRLAEAVYPVIATRGVEITVTTILILGMMVPLPPLINPRVPSELAYASFFLYIPALHRLSLVHTRRFLLLLRQFETWYLGISTVIFLLSAFTAGKPGHVVRVYALNVCTAGWSMIMLDAIRMPRFIGLCTVLMSWAVVIFWGVYFFFALGSWYMDYDMLWVGSIRRTGVALGRIGIAVLFFGKYTVNLLLRPDACVILRRPLFVRDARSIIEQRYGQSATAALLRHLSSRREKGHSKVAPLAPEPTTTAADVSNPLFTDKQVNTMSPPPTDSTTPVAEIVPTDGSQAPQAGPPPLPSDPGVPSSPSRNPRRLPPLPRPSTSSTPEAPSASAHLPDDPPEPPHEASAPLPEIPKPSSSDEPTPLAPPQPVEEPPFLLHHYLHLPAPLIHSLSHPTVQRAECVLWLITSVLCTVPLFLPPPFPPWLLHLSWLWLLLVLRRLLFIYPELLVIQLCQFETCLLLANVAFGLVTLGWGVFTTSPANAWAVNLLLSNLPAILLDSLHIHASVKQKIAATQSLFLLGVCAANSLLPCPFMDGEVMIISRVTAGSFFMGRLFTLAIFILKYAVNVWLRPDTFLVLCAPFMRRQRLGLLVRTLRELQ